MSLKRAFVVGVVGAFLLACGGTDVTPGGKDGGPDGTVGTDGGGTVPDGSTNTDSGAGGDGAMNPDGNTITDGGADGSMNGGVPCGMMTCAQNEKCCVDINGMAPVYTCTSMTCMAGQVELSCNSNKDCPMNQVCCLNAAPDPYVVSCQSSCKGANHAILCDPMGTAMNNSCGDAGACGNMNIDTWGLSTNYGTCGDTNGPF